MAPLAGVLAKHLGHYVTQILYDFQGSPDGANPLFMGVVLDGGGNIYGTTFSGGTSGLGTVF